MRIKTELAERPPEFTVSREGQKAVIIFYTDVQEVQRDEGTVFEAVSWTLEVPWTDNLEARITAATEGWFALAQQQATDIAAAAVRAIRDQLLKDSDAAMALDRLGLVVPSGSTFSSWLSFLKGLGDVLSNRVAIYRQALRDLPNQPGFPFEIDWPEKP